MPKMKTNSGASKRFKVTGSGNIARKCAFRRHLLATKNAKRRRRLRADALVHPTDLPRLKQMLVL